MQLRLANHPWTAEDETAMDARKMFLEATRNLHKLGWHLYGKSSFNSAADNVYYIRHPNGDNRWIFFDFPLRSSHNNYSWSEKTSDEFCMISLNKNDRMRLIDCGDAVQTAVHDTLIALGGDGYIQDEGESLGTYEFKLAGEWNDFRNVFPAKFQEIHSAPKTPTTLTGG